MHDGYQARDDRDAEWFDAFDDDHAAAVERDRAVRRGDRAEVVRPYDGGGGRDEAAWPSSLPQRFDAAYDDEALPRTRRSHGRPAPDDERTTPFTPLASDLPAPPAAPQGGRPVPRDDVDRLPSRYGDQAPGDDRAGGRRTARSERAPQRPARDEVDRRWRGPGARSAAGAAITWSDDGRAAPRAPGPVADMTTQTGAAGAATPSAWSDRVPRPDGAPSGDRALRPDHAPRPDGAPSGDRALPPDRGPSRDRAPSPDREPASTDRGHPSPDRGHAAHDRGSAPPDAQAAPPDRAEAGGRASTPALVAVPADRTAAPARASEARDRPSSSATAAIRQSVERVVPALDQLRSSLGRVGDRVRRSVPTRTIAFLLPPLLLPWLAFDLSLPAALLVAALLVWVAAAAGVFASLMIDGWRPTAARRPPDDDATTPSSATDEALATVAARLDDLARRVDALGSRHEPPIEAEGSPVAQRDRTAVGDDDRDGPQRGAGGYWRNPTWRR